VLAIEEEAERPGEPAAGEGEEPHAPVLAHSPTRVITPTDAPGVLPT
jgi:hypothetical protein